MSISLSNKRLKMLVTLIALGTRGDVQPLIALALSLQNRFSVQMVIDAAYESMAEDCRIPYCSIFGTNTMFQQGTVYRKINECVEACRGSDAIVFSPHPFSIIGYHIAEKFDIPCFWAASFPMHHLGGINRRLLPGKNIYGFYNRQFHFTVNLWREKHLKLKPLPMLPVEIPWKRMCEQNVPVLYFFSSILMERPRDWGESAHITGFWFLDSKIDETIPPAVLDFLSSGPPPVYFGFGSVFESMPDVILKSIENRVREHRMRAIIQTNRQEGAEQKDENILFIDTIPHQWLFKKVCAVVFHGGLNTTGVVLRLGIPFVVVPFMTDGPLWAHLCEKIGVSPPPVLPRDFGGATLFNRIHEAMTLNGIQQKLKKAKKVIAGEKGIEKAVSIIEYHLT